jgi:hypothetical protein
MAGNSMSYRYHGKDARMKLVTNKRDANSFCVSPAKLGAQ